MILALASLHHKVIMITFYLSFLIFNFCFLISSLIFVDMEMTLNQIIGGPRKSSDKNASPSKKKSSILPSTSTPSENYHPTLEAAIPIQSLLALSK